MNQKKSLVINSAYSVLYKVLNVVFPLITATYTARLLLAEGIGKVSYAQNIVQYFVVFSSLGIPNYGIREIAKCQGDKKDTDKTFIELFLISFCSTTVCIIAYFIMIFRVEYFRRNILLFLAVGISLGLNYINVDWFYQGKEEYSYLALRNCLVKIISLVLLFVFVKDSSDYINYAIISCIASAGNYIFNIFNLKHKVELTFRTINITRHLKPVLILMASNISIELYTMVDVTMLGILCSSNIVGYYHNATRLARIINSTISSLAFVLLPRLSLYYHRGFREELDLVVNRVLHILISLTVPAACGVLLLADDIIAVFFGESFMPAVMTLRILSVLIVAVALNNFLGTQILLTFNREIDLLKSVIIGAIVNIVLNLILIPAYAHNGAAIASVISELSVLFTTYVFVCRKVKLRISSGFWVSLAASVLLMIIVVSGIRFIRFPVLIEMLLGITLGASSYVLFGKLTKNEGIIELNNVMKRALLKLYKK